MHVYAIVPFVCILYWPEIIGSGRNNIAYFKSRIFYFFQLVVLFFDRIKNNKLYFIAAIRGTTKVSIEARSSEFSCLINFFRDFYYRTSESLLSLSYSSSDLSLPQQFTETDNFLFKN